MTDSAHKQHLFIGFTSKFALPIISRTKLTNAKHTSCGYLVSKVFLLYTSIFILRCL